MRKTRLLSLLLFVIFISGCISAYRKGYEKDYKAICEYSINMKNSNIFCGCLTEYISSKFSDEELKLLKTANGVFKKIPQNLKAKYKKYELDNIQNN